MMRRAACLGNEQAIEYLQERGLSIVMDNFVAVGGQTLQ